MAVDYLEVRNQFQQCKKKWWQSSKKRSLELINHFEKQINKPYSGSQQFIDFMNDDFFECLEFISEEIAEKISEYLAFAVNQENQIDVIESRIKGLQLKYQENQFSGMLTPDNFFDDLINPKFPYYTYIRIYMDVEEEVKEHFENENPDFKYIFFKPTKEIFTLTKLITELILLKKLHEQFDQSQDKSKIVELPPNFEENKYPKVFRSGYGYELFRYLVKVEDVDIGPAWAMKYFDLFQDEKLIKKPLAKASFIRFLNKTFGTTITELDKRASYTGDDINFLKDVEKDFQKLHNVTR